MCDGRIVRISLEMVVTADCALGLTQKDTKLFCTTHGATGAGAGSTVEHLSRPLYAVTVASWTRTARPGDLESFERADEREREHRHVVHHVCTPCPCTMYTI